MLFQDVARGLGPPEPKRLRRPWLALQRAVCFAGRGTVLVPALLLATFEVLERSHALAHLGLF